MERFQTISVEPAVEVLCSNGRPARGVEVTLQAVSAEGANASSRVRTDERGRASSELLFEDAPPGALQIAVMAWLPNGEGTEMKLSLRNFLDWEFVLEQNLVAGPLPASVAGLDATVSAKASARSRVILFETEKGWKHYEVAAYGTMPVQVVHRSLCCDELRRWQPLGTAAGPGDPQAGVSLSLPYFSADVAYNGRSGRLSLPDFFRTVGAGAVHISDGIETIESNAQVSLYPGRRKLLFAGIAHSRARPRRYDQGDRLERGDYFSQYFGIGFVRRSMSSALLLTAGHGEFGPLEIFRAPGLPAQGTLSLGVPTQPSILLPRREEFTFGLSRIALSRRAASVDLHVMVGGIGTSRPYFSATVRTTIRLF
jgi:hypothetical protein